MDNALFRGYTTPTSWRPIPEIGNWPLDHVFVTADTGECWPCYGRGIDELPEARFVCEGVGNLEWIVEIAGEVTDRSCAGVDHEINGVCHCAANRLLLIAGVDVRDAPGNEIVIPIFGKYGMGIQDFVIRIKDAAKRVNDRHPSIISDDDVEKAVQRVLHSKESECAILMDDIEDNLHVNRADIPPTLLQEMKSIYSVLYDKRTASYDSYKVGQLTTEQYRNEMRKNVVMAFCQVQDVLGNEQYSRIIKWNPTVAAMALFGK
jgi:hypothetical protein